ncbi:hypothetical protein R6Q59_016665 [Mikania micrantha]
MLVHLTLKLVGDSLRVSFLKYFAALFILKIGAWWIGATNTAKTRVVKLIQKIIEFFMQGVSGGCNIVDS